MIQENIVKESDLWLNEKSAMQHVVVSSRARLARNIPRIPFATHATPEELIRITRAIDRVISGNPGLNAFHPISLHEAPQLIRRYLKESHIISSEMEKGEQHRVIYVSPDFHISIMVNEEDHIRIQGLTAGMKIQDILGEILKIDDLLTEKLPVAFSDQYGYLTACPSNLGTGLRVSVMLHLPGLVMTNNIEKIVKMIQPHGLTVRGFYGENSEFDGDFYQISNELSLGKSEGEIVSLLVDVIKNIIHQEGKAREELFSRQVIMTEDSIWRSFAILSQARLIDTQEAMKLLSHIRLGIDRGYFSFLDHNLLNKLVIEIQPAHLEYLRTDQRGSEARDMARATLLRNYFNMPGSKN